jgi:hypothetical protein
VRAQHAGAPLLYVSTALGHAKATTTLQHYAHYLPTGDRAVADRLEALRTGPDFLKDSSRTSGSNGGSR